MCVDMRTDMRVDMRAAMRRGMCCAPFSTDARRRDGSEYPPCLYRRHWAFQKPHGEPENNLFFAAANDGHAIIRTEPHTDRTTNGAAIGRSDGAADPTADGQTQLHGVQGPIMLWPVQLWPLYLWPI